MFRTKSLALVLVALTLSPAEALADVKLHGLFTENMVLQQGTTVPIWGTAAKDERVTVRFQGQEVSTEAKDGKWRVDLKDLKPGGPFAMTIEGKNKIEFKDVLVGEVWVASGQSNMEWQLWGVKTGKQDIADSANSMIRLFQVPKTPANSPQTELGLGRGAPPWRVCDPKSTEKFSAIGYYFARDLQKALKIPVGIIHGSWSGSQAEIWTSQETLAAHPETKHWKISNLYNGMLRPLMPYAIKGVIWYQGEANVDRAAQYKVLFPAMIKNWRDDWKQGDFPFLFVQLAPWDVPKKATWPELRDVQLWTSQNVKNTAMVVITDLGDREDIHPRIKDPVGARLALCARGLAYGEKLVYSGPEYSGMKIDGNKIVLSFKHVGAGLEAKGGPLTGFTIAGADDKFVDAQAEIVGDTVVVRSDKVENPVAVRYGWANFPVVNLWNRDGLPATPFRTAAPK